MTKETAIAEATKIANTKNMVMAVVNDAMANAEEENGPWGYCPNEARHTEGLRKGDLIMFPWAEEIIIIRPK